LCVVAWDDLSMEIKQRMREMDERLARGFAEIMGRMEEAERRWEEDERARKREWEELEGRAMTAMEEHRHYNDGLLRKMDTMTVFQVNIAREIQEEHKKGFAEMRSEGRAHREALLRLLDRLPPRENEGS
jgi:hypothetical protein